jgi:CubicO group peptidase (beta-lactamase class C family)
MGSTPILDGLRAGQPPVGVPGETHAVLVARHDDLLCEFYANEASVPCGPDTTHRSWSVAKSVVHAVVGTMLLDPDLPGGPLDLNAPAAVAAWRDDERQAITLNHLLDMRSGLAWNEEYADTDESDVVAMLWGAGRHDVAAYAAARPLAAPPGSTWYYSSGTTNIICRILSDALVGAGGDHNPADATPAARRAAFEAYCRGHLFGPVGMTRATAKFDDAGTFVGSSFLFATARDYLRFGQLYADGGVVGATRILPEGWTTRAGARTSAGDEPDLDYGSHWWLFNQLPGSLAACGYEGQFVIVLPAERLVVVRLGRTPIDDDPVVRQWLVRLVGEVLGVT